MISRPLPPIGSEPTNRARQYVPVRLAKVPEKDKAALPQSTVVEAIEDTADPGTRARYTLQSTVQSTVVEAIDDMPGLEVVLKAATRDESTVVEKGQEMEVPSWWPNQPSNDRTRTHVYRVPTDVDPALSQQLPDSDRRLARELVTAGRLARGIFITTAVNLGTDPDMPALIDYKMSRSRSNTFERRPRVEPSRTSESVGTRCGVDVSRQV
jgi:hypothetical protein